MSLRFQVMFEDTPAAKVCLAKCELDDNTVRTKIDEALREIVVERMAMFNMDERIKQMLDRRVQLAVDAILKKAEAEAAVVAMQRVRARVVEHVNAMPLGVSVVAGGAA